MKIFIVGMMGSGKSFLCKQIAKALHIADADIDLMITQQEQTTIEQIFSTKGEAYFRTLETNYLRTFEHKNNFVLATGGGTACFNNNIQWMNEQGTTIWLNEPINILVERLYNKQQHNRPLIKDLDKPVLTNFLSTLLNKRQQFYEQANIIYNSNQPLEELILQLKSINS